VNEGEAVVTARPSAASLPARLRRMGLAFSVGGYVFTAVILYSFLAFGQWQWPGDDARIWDRVGDEFRAGISPYLDPSVTAGFYYAPPWALAFGAVSWLPMPVVNLGINVLEVASLRYIAGSWLRVGYLCWLPMVALELFGAQWNLVMAAAIAAALRGEPRPAVVMAAAKLSPVLAIDWHHWRRALAVAAVLAVITLPWAGLWVEWVRKLLGAYGATTAPGAQLSLPFAPRLALALGLLAVRRPWARGLAAIVATPVLYWASAVLFLGLLRDERPPASESGMRA
jgi:hypothetical protein